ncbi:glycosyltransferase family 2 protein [Roseomonas sp. HJA6]|uniref:Glycosyltransferase family 2 protein n=1 Tax=Roseomonas alba TaxID=2846776 RepID=A0ABS7A8V7_9PROT|nr:glycosyltransferase family 2 protein [Neoroseomonas alba]MBW6398722.1 glycosyltransferase family 2 protein [Neoroseomonas alba]
MIVIPMAGLSRRFTEAGYQLPKYMLPLHGRSVFAHAVGSFAAYFDSHPFLFIARDVAGTGDFLAAEARALGIRDARVAMLDAPTAGQAETVELGLATAGVAGETPVTIFNIDTFRPGFTFPAGAWWAGSDGYLEVFRGAGANWSYVRPAPGEEPLAVETAEKRPISDLCCTGLYHFRRAGDFLDALAAERAAPSAPELYVAPIYNHLIRQGRRIHYEVVPSEAVVFCGVPAEYEALEAEPVGPG